MIIVKAVYKQAQDFDCSYSYRCPMSILIIFGKTVPMKLVVMAKSIGMDLPDRIKSVHITESNFFLVFDSVESAVGYRLSVILTVS